MAVEETAKMPRETLDWETVAEGPRSFTQRFAVDGGWIYRTKMDNGCAMCFVPRSLLGGTPSTVLVPGQTESQTQLNLLTGVDPPNFVVTNLNGLLVHAIEFFPSVHRRANGEIDTGTLGKEVKRVALSPEDANANLDDLIEKYG